MTGNFAVLQQRKSERFLQNEADLMHELPHDEAELN
jgi:hypothetical protein